MLFSSDESIDVFLAVDGGGDAAQLLAVLEEDDDGDGHTAVLAGNGGAAVNVDFEETEIFP